MRGLGFLLAALLIPACALAGPNAGGTLVVHDASLLVSSTNSSSSICGQGTVPDSCAAVDTQLDGSSSSAPKIWKVYAAFPASSSPRLMGVSWGIHFDGDLLSVDAAGNCGDWELNDNGWPSSDLGSQVTWHTAQTGHLVPVYWFAGYQVSLTATAFELRGHPTQGGNFGDDTTPAVLDSVADNGKLGFGRIGYLPCLGSGDTDGPTSPDYHIGSDAHRFVWALHVGETAAEIRVNRFAEPRYRKLFPLQTIRLVRTEWEKGPSMRCRGWTMQAPVHPNGTLGDPSLTLPAIESPAKALAPALLSARILTRLKELQIDPSTIGGWDTAPDSGLAVIRLPKRTVLLNETDPSKPAVSYPLTIAQPAFAHTGSCAAAATDDGRVLVFDRSGRIVFATDASSTSYDQLYINPSCSTLTYIQETADGRKAGALDIRSGQSQALSNIPDGFRYYSADGSRMLIIARGVPGLVSYYDTSTPMSPLLVGEYSVACPILTAAVCDDGRLAAVEEDEGSGRHFRVVLLDGSVRPIGDPLVTNCTSQGLQFEGKFLFVGVQRHPLPAPIQSISTENVLLFDLSF
jgi:hypothetical protein